MRNWEVGNWYGKGGTKTGIKQINGKLKREGKLDSGYCTCSPFNLSKARAPICRLHAVDFVSGANISLLTCTTACSSVVYIIGHRTGHVTDSASVFFSLLCGAIRRHPSFTYLRERAFVQIATALLLIFVRILLLHCVSEKKTHKTFGLTSSKRTAIINDFCRWYHNSTAHWPSFIWFRYDIWQDKN